MRKLILALVIVGLALLVLALPLGAQAQSMTRDCDSNAVIRCGVISTSEFQQKYPSQSGASAIFSFFGISGTDIQQLDSTAVMGQVTRSGLVIVNGKTVANGAITAGRQNIAGSTAVTNNGVRFFTRPPNISFVSSRQAAFVVMNSGRFSFAILTSCGNPVMATPLTPEVTKTTTVISKPIIVTPAAPAQTQPETQTQSQSVTVNTPAAPEVQTVAAAAPPAAKAVIPNTGPGNVAGIGLISTIFGGLGHFIYTTRRKAV